jgi:hypothetical protein
MTRRIGRAVAFKCLSITDEETTYEETGDFAMKRNILARWALLSALASMGSVGLFGTSVGAAQVVKAADCLSGTAFDPVKAACVPCPKGKYSDHDGATACDKCPEGHICEKPGTSGPQLCKANQAANFQRTQCIECLNGFYSFEGAQCTTETNTMNFCCLSKD